MRMVSLLSGLVSTLPGGNEWLFKWRRARKHSTGTASARYCYAVWLTHLTMAHRYGVIQTIPGYVAEIGPGNSLGTGLAALLSGANEYYAFDVVKHTTIDKNVKILDELIALFRSRANIPDREEFPQIVTELDSYKFPHDIITDECLETALQQGRLFAIKDDLVNKHSKFIKYTVPWNDREIIKDSSIDMIFSMSVLEHVDDLRAAYESAYKWLKSGGVMSHEIDFKCHGHSNKWNGHWAYADLTWRIIRGNRPYLINRCPHSFHIDLLRESNFKIIADITKQDQFGIARDELARTFSNLSDQDMTTHNAYMLSIKG